MFHKNSKLLLVREFDITFCIRAFFFFGPRHKRALMIIIIIFDTKDFNDFLCACFDSFLKSLSF